MTGAPGTSEVVRSTGFDAAPAPSALTARIRAAYRVPSVSPVTVIGLVVVPADGPGAAVELVLVAGDRPSRRWRRALKARTALVGPVVAVVMDGAPGVVAGMPVTGAEAGPAPMALTARTVMLVRRCRWSGR